MNFFNFFKKKEMWLTVNLLFMFVYVVLITKSNDKICVIVHEGYWTSNPLVTFEELLSMIFSQFTDDIHMIWTQKGSSQLIEEIQIGHMPLLTNLMYWKNVDKNKKIRHINICASIWKDTTASSLTEEDQFLGFPSPCDILWVDTMSDN